MKTKLGDILTVAILIAMCLTTGYILTLNNDAMKNPSTLWSKP